MYFEKCAIIPLFYLHCKGCPYKTLGIFLFYNKKLKKKERYTRNIFINEDRKMWVLCRRYSYNLYILGIYFHLCKYYVHTYQMYSYKFKICYGGVHENQLFVTLITIQETYNRRKLYLGTLVAPYNNIALVSNL